MLRNLRLRFFEEPASYKFLPGNDKEKPLIEYGGRFARELVAEKTE